jgi:hypothetical protein
MRVVKDSFIVLATLAALHSCIDARAAMPMYEELRYCGAPKRDADGDIIRNSNVTRRFQLLHPCPRTGALTGACPGWAIDHVIPLACGGCDAVSNMQWLDTTTKARKDRYERSIGAASPPMPDTGACRLRLVPTAPRKRAG